MNYRWFDLPLTRYTVSGIVIGFALVALIKAWLQS